MKKYDNLTFVEYMSMAEEEKKKVTRNQLLDMIERSKEDMTKTLRQEEAPSDSVKEFETEIVEDTTIEDTDEIEDETPIESKSEETSLIPIPKETETALVNVFNDFQLKVVDFAKNNPGTTALVAVGVGATTGALVAQGVANGTFEGLLSKVNPLNLANSVGNFFNKQQDNLQLPSPDKVVFDNGTNSINLPDGFIFPDAAGSAKYGGQAECLTDEQIVTIRDAILNKKILDERKAGGEYEIIKVGEKVLTPSNCKKITVTETITCPDSSTRKLIVGYRFKLK